MRNKKGGLYISEETDSETDLYGVSPWLIGQLMFIVTILVPIGYVPMDNGIIVVTSWLFGPFLYGLLWVWFLSSQSPFVIPGFSLFNLQYMWILVPLSIFSILFLRQMVRYYQGKSSRDSVLVVGFLSFLFPSLVCLIQTLLVSLIQIQSALDLSQFSIVIPIPIQFIIGLVILHKIEGPEVTSPWHGQSADWSFWKRPRATWLDRTQDAVETNLEEEHDENNSPETESK